jgi:hypothetical protein
VSALSPLVRALRFCVTTAAAVVVLSACGSAPRPGAGPALSPPAAVKPQVPQLVPTQPPADLGSVERYAWQQVVMLGDAFAAGDIPGFLARVSRGFYRGYGKLEASLVALLEGSRARDVVVAIRLVTEDEGRISVRAEWTRSVTLPDGSVDARRGETVFLFLKSDTSLRLIDYRGDAPFALDGI